MSSETCDTNVLGTMNPDGGLHFLMDVDLPGALGISTDDLKKKFESIQRLTTELDDLKSSLQNDVKKRMSQMKDSLDYLKERYQDRENREDQTENLDEDEPGIALEDQLRITEQSAKAIELLSSHLLSTVWQNCSKNTFGKFNPSFI
jgi:predicted nuclease with TOPRIM domain